MKIIWHRISIQTLLFQACLPTRQNALKTGRDKAYGSDRIKIWEFCEEFGTLWRRNRSPCTNTVFCVVFARTFKMTDRDYECEV